jgi:hypothetical protein
MWTRERVSGRMKARTVVAEASAAAYGLDVAQRPWPRPRTAAGAAMHCLLSPSERSRVRYAVLRTPLTAHEERGTFPVTRQFIRGRHRRFLAFTERGIFALTLGTTVHVGLGGARAAGGASLRNRRIWSRQGRREGVSVGSWAVRRRTNQSASFGGPVCLPP